MAAYLGEGIKLETNEEVSQIWNELERPLKWEEDEGRLMHDRDPPRGDSGGRVPGHGTTSVPFRVQDVGHERKDTSTKGR